jgi:hypothetical protein
VSFQSTGPSGRIQSRGRCSSRRHVQEVDVTCVMQFTYIQLVGCKCMWPHDTVGVVPRNFSTQKSTYITVHVAHIFSNDVSRGAYVYFDQRNGLIG